VEVLIDIGDPASTIVRVSEDLEADLIVMGRRGRGDLGGLLLGSVSHKVGHLAACAVMTVR
jgi:nucleotide-binding universal stress UspA family protein